MFPIGFGIITENKLLRVPKANLIPTYENLSFTSTNKEGELVKLNFVKNWLKDEQMRTYDKIDFLPTQQAPPHTYNTFSGFIGKNPGIN